MPLPVSLPTLLPGPLDAYAPTLSASGGGSGSLASVSDMCADAQALILAQYKDSPRLLALLCSYVDRVQQIDNALVAVYQHTLSVDTAELVHLDRLGRIVGESRNGLADPAFRRGVRTRVLVNRSQGRTNDLAAIAALFCSVAEETGAYVRVSSHRPGTVTVRTDRSALADPTELVKRLRRATSAGVRLNSVTPPAERTAGLRLVRPADFVAGTSPTGLSQIATPGSGGDLWIALQ